MDRDRQVLHVAGQVREPESTISAPCSFAMAMTSFGVASGFPLRLEGLGGKA